MAFFKFRKGGDEQTTSTPPAESVEAMRKRAKHRLIGTAILVLAGVIGFPLLVDKQPRPIAVDIPIDIPDRNKVKPLPAPLPVAAPQADKPAAVAAAEPQPAAAPKAEPKAEPKPKQEPEPQPVAKDKDKPAAKPTPDAGTKAQALLEGKEPPSSPAADKGRIVVQVGAFADPAKAREVRLKVERAGMKTYTHVAQTKDGPRTRVRVGPFATREEAEKAAVKIKKLDLPVSILTL